METTPSASTVQDEVKALFAAQRHGTQRTEALEDAICLPDLGEEVLDHDARELVGECPYFPGEKRAASAEISSELCRAYERLGHIVIVHEDGSEQALTANQIDDYLKILFSTASIKGNKDCKVTYGPSARTWTSAERVQGHKTREELCPKAWRCLRQRSCMFEDRQGDAICEALTFASMASLIERLSDLGLSDDERDAILAVPFTGKLFKGYGSRSPLGCS